MTSSLTNRSPVIDNRSSTTGVWLCIYKRGYKEWNSSDRQTDRQSETETLESVTESTMTNIVLSQLQHLTHTQPFYSPFQGPPG